ncbi:hypothetical protein F2Q68_00026018 [Brassica cretica]|uniref:Uncharacterized protein n=1 Tax=Brassica cretica TaxID=69181 RepID=A0A8S9I7P2_BRACR|nr:hypothetical protein F2Q68_00026018 [Brassica cretica]
MVWISGFGELVSDSQSDGMCYAFDPSSDAMEMESSVVVLFTLQELPNSFYEKVESSVTPVVDIDFFPTKVHARVWVNVRVTTRCPINFLQRIRLLGEQSLGDKKELDRDDTCSGLIDDD